jgi:hypothetical protein
MFFRSRSRSIRFSEVEAALIRCDVTTVTTLLEQGTALPPTALQSALTNCDHPDFFVLLDIIAQSKSCTNAKLNAEAVYVFFKREKSNQRCLKFLEHVQTHFSIDWDFSRHKAPFSYAILYSSCPEALIKISQWEPHFVNARDSCGYTPMQHIISQYSKLGPTKCIKLLAILEQCKAKIEFADHSNASTSNAELAAAMPLARGSSDSAGSSPRETSSLDSLKTEENIKTPDDPPPQTAIAMAGAIGQWHIAYRLYRYVQQEWPEQAARHRENIATNIRRDLLKQHAAQQRKNACALEPLEKSLLVANIQLCHLHRLLTQKLSTDTILIQKQIAAHEEAKIKAATDIAALKQQLATPFNLDNCDILSQMERINSAFVPLAPPIVAFVQHYGSEYCDQILLGEMQNQPRSEKIDARFINLLNNIRQLAQVEKHELVYAVTLFHVYATASTTAAIKQNDSPVFSRPSLHTKSSPDLRIKP